MRVNNRPCRLETRRAGIRKATIEAQHEDFGKVIKSKPHKSKVSDFWGLAIRV